VLGIASDVHLTTWEHLAAACDLLGASSGTSAAAAGPMVCSPAMFRLQRVQSEAAETQCVEGTASLCTALYRALVRVRLTPEEPPLCCVIFGELACNQLSLFRPSTPLPTPPPHTHTPHTHLTRTPHTYIHAPRCCPLSVPAAAGPVMVAGAPCPARPRCPPPPVCNL
jgi:hypothetical protein